MLLHKKAVAIEIESLIFKEPQNIFWNNTDFIKSKYMYN